MSGPRVPQLAYPMRLDDTGAIAQVEQDQQADLEGCVLVLRRTERGTRPLAPLIGVEDPTFTEGLNAEQIADELADQEPRARVEITVSPVDQAGQQTVTIDVSPADTSPDEFGEQED